MKKFPYVVAALVPLSSGAVDFEKPYQLKGGEAVIELESPGYAAPALYDLDGDGVKDLLVGQFMEGKVMVYKGKGEGKFAEGKPLEAGGEVVKIPGVW